MRHWTEKQWLSLFSMLDLMIVSRNVIIIHVITAPKIKKSFNHFYLDGISPARTAETIVIVNVVDLSDHSPVFLQDHYNVSVFENLAVGTTVLTVEATDNDKVKQNRRPVTITETVL